MSKVSCCDCVSCLKGKITKLPFDLSTSVSTYPHALLHSDVWGPSPSISISGFRYYVSFVDDYIKYTWIFPLTYKSDVQSVIKHFVPFIKNQLSCCLKVFRSDGGVNLLTSQFMIFSLLGHCSSTFMSTYPLTEWRG